jgi:hypothetical protein
MPSRGQKVLLSCWFDSVAIAQRSGDFGGSMRAKAANHGIVTDIGCSRS